MKILIAGGTGFIGRAIVRALAAHHPEHTPVILSRHPGPTSKLETRQGDVTDRESLRDVLDGIDAVIQTVQFPNHPVQNPKKGYTYEKYDAEGTENICSFIKGSAVKRVIYLSGAGTSPEKTEPWFKAKVRAEAAVKATGKEFVILRPSWVYGADDRSLNKFIEFGKYLPVMPVIGDGTSRVAPVFVDDLAEICLRSLISNEAKNQTFEIGGPEVLTMNEIQEKVLKLLGKRKPLVHNPLWLMKVVGGVMSAVLPTPPLSPEAVDFVNMDNPTDGKAAELLLGKKLRTLDSAVASYLP